MKIDNKIFITLTVITVFTTALIGEMYSDSFIINFLTIPILIFGCFLLSGAIFIIPYFLIGYILNSISDFLKTLRDKNKKIVCFIFTIIVWLMLSYIVTYVKL